MRLTLGACLKQNLKTFWLSKSTRQHNHWEVTSRVLQVDHPVKSWERQLPHVVVPKQTWTPSSSRRRLYVVTFVKKCDPERRGEQDRRARGVEVREAVSLGRPTSGRVEGNVKSTTGGGSEDWIWIFTYRRLVPCWSGQDGETSVHRELIELFTGPGVLWSLRSQTRPVRAKERHSSVFSFTTSSAGTTTVTQTYFKAPCSRISVFTQRPKQGIKKWLHLLT